MEGGAWQSDLYEVGRDAQKTRAPPAQAQRTMERDTGTVPAMYNIPTSVGKEKDSKLFGLVVVILRGMLILLSLIALGVMVASKQSYYVSMQDSLGYFFTTSTAKFTEVKAFVGLVVVLAMVCIYAVAQLVMCLVQLASNGTFISAVASTGSLLTFIFDSVLAYTLIAAAGAAADSQAILSKNDVCSVVPGFCHKAQASIALSVITFVLLASAAALFPVRLLRLSK